MFSFISTLFVVAWIGSASVMFKLWFCLLAAKSLKTVFERKRKQCFGKEREVGSAREQSPENFYFGPVLPPAFTLSFPKRPFPPPSLIHTFRKQGTLPESLSVSGNQAHRAAVSWAGSDVKAIVPARSSIVEGKEQQQKQKTPAEGAEREGGRDVWAISVKWLLPQEQPARWWDTVTLACSAAEFITVIYLRSMSC